jgi:hypothetical protein
MLLYEIETVRPLFVILFFIKRNSMPPPEYHLNNNGVHAELVQRQTSDK